MTASDDWSAFGQDVRDLSQSIRQSTAVNVNREDLRSKARQAVQLYFRRVRPHLVQLTFAEAELQPLDTQLQSLLRLSNGRNRRDSYLEVLAEAQAEAQSIEMLRERRLGEAQDSTRHPPSAVEMKIIETLDRMIPSAANSYRQALEDIHDSNRASYRGTAGELRECVRESLDRLAPDSEVMASQGFRLEPNRTRPTQKQKMRFILRSRGQSASQTRSAEDAAGLVEELTASLARSVYDRGSIATHRSVTQREVFQLKMYVDTVLSELLEISL